MNRLSVLKDIISKRYHEIFEEERFIDQYQFKDYRDNLLFNLSEKQKKSLQNSTGSAFEEIAKINSSTALGINVYSLLQRSTNEINNLEYEIKIGRPLSKGYPSNLDVSYQRKGITHFIECKFLEPYYMETKATIAGLSSYYDVDKYQILSRKHANDWVQIFKMFTETITNGEIVYYDIIQMLKHLLSIYNFSINNKKTVMIRLDNVCWNMNEPFFKYLKTEEEENTFSAIRAKHHEEANRCIAILNDFIRTTLGLNTISVRFIYYCDLLKEVQASPSLDSLSKRYFLFGEQS